MESVVLKGNSQKLIITIAHIHGWSTPMITVQQKGAWKDPDSGFSPVFNQGLNTGEISYKNITVQQIDDTASKDVNVFQSTDRRFT